MAIANFSAVEAARNEADWDRNENKLEYNED